MGHRNIITVSIVALAVTLAGCFGETPEPAAAANPDAVTPDSALTLRFVPATDTPPQLAAAPTGMAADFARLLNETAAAGGLPVAAPAAPATYIVSGAVTKGEGATGTLTIAALDVIDQAGHRVHRIAVEQVGRGDSIAPSLTTVAEQAVRELKAWHTRTADRLTAAKVAKAAQPGGGPVYLVTVTDGPAAAPAGNDNGNGNGNGGGNTALAAALRAALERQAPASPGPTGAPPMGQAAVPAKTAKPHAYIVSGHVKTSPLTQARTDVSIDWTVRTLSGVALGTINQRGKIETTALTSHWPRLAGSAAEAAADGVWQLVAPPPAPNPSQKT